jgi:hypothetical protein
MGPVLQAHLPTQTLDDGGDDGQPKARAIGAVAAIETFENARDISLVDTRALILDNPVRNDCPDA